MKLFMVIVNEEYQNVVSSIFQSQNCSATIIASTGDFLQYGNIIFLLGMEEEKANQLIRALKAELGSDLDEHKQTIVSQKIAVQSMVTVFCIDIIQYHKILGGERCNDQSDEQSTTIPTERST